MPAETFTMVAYCPVCEKDTDHRIETTGHERDSSGDLETCLTCKSYKTGWTDEWTTPDKKRKRR